MKLLDKSKQEYEYILNEEKFSTEEALHAAHDETCVSGEHDWKKSFSFGMYSCRNCDAKRRKE